jgi:hypothetical protein
MMMMIIIIDPILFAMMLDNRAAEPTNNSGLPLFFFLNLVLFFPLSPKTTKNPQPLLLTVW